MLDPFSLDAGPSAFDGITQAAATPLLSQHRVWDLPTRLRSDEPVPGHAGADFLRHRKPSIQLASNCSACPSTIDTPSGGMRTLLSLEAGLCQSRLLA